MACKDDHRPANRNQPRSGYTELPNANRIAQNCTTHSESTDSRRPASNFPPADRRHSVKTSRPAAALPSSPPSPFSFLPRNQQSKVRIGKTPAFTLQRSLVRVQLPPLIRPPVMAAFCFASVAWVWLVREYQLKRDVCQLVIVSTASPPRNSPVREHHQSPACLITTKRLLIE